MRRLASTFFLVCWLHGCAARRAAVQTPTTFTPERGSYIDLEPGWRISVITPLLKSGGFALDRSGEPMRVSGTDRGLSVEMAAGPEFLGYERSYYAVEARDRDVSGGVRVRFTSAEAVREGKAVAQARPVAELFRLPGWARHVRLVYLLRSSQVNHNMAVLAARERSALEPLTSAVQRDPAAGCQSRSGVVCQWVPAGIAVRPEKKNAADWAPAR